MQQSQYCCSAHDLSFTVYDNLYQQGEQKLTAYPKAQGQIFSLVGLGYDALGNNERSLQAAQRTLDLMRGAPDVSDYELADVWLNLAESLRNTERFDESEDAARSGLALLETRDHPEAAQRRLTALNRVAMLHLHRGQIHDSIKAHEQLLEQRIALYGADSVRPAVDYFNLATSQHAVGLDQQALSNYESAAKLLQANGDGESVRMGFVMHGLAEASTFLDADLAQDYVDKARRIYVASLPPEHKRLLTLDLTELEIWRQRGEADRVEPMVRELLQRPDLTDKQLNQMRSLLAATLMDLERWPDAAELYGELATVDTGQYGRLQPFFAAALAYANYQAGATEQSPMPTIEHAREALTQIRHERTPPYRRLEQWRKEFGG